MKSMEERVRESNRNRKKELKRTPSKQMCPVCMETTSYLKNGMCPECNGMSPEPTGSFLREWQDSK